jgi:hypothetical protein
MVLGQTSDGRSFVAIVVSCGSGLGQWACGFGHGGTRLHICFIEVQPLDGHLRPSGKESCQVRTWVQDPLSGFAVNADAPIAVSDHRKPIVRFVAPDFDQAPTELPCSAT